MCDLYKVHENGDVSIVMDEMKNDSFDIRLIVKNNVQKQLVNLYTGMDGNGKRVLVPVNCDAPLDILYWNDWKLKTLLGFI